MNAPISVLIMKLDEYLRLSGLLRQGVTPRKRFVEVFAEREALVDSLNATPADHVYDLIMRLTIIQLHLAETLSNSSAIVRQIDGVLELTIAELAAGLLNAPYEPLVIDGGERAQ
jgi:hypothetical protein